MADCSVYVVFVPTAHAAAHVLLVHVLDVFYLVYTMSLYVLCTSIRDRLEDKSCLNRVHTIAYTHG